MFDKVIVCVYSITILTVYAQQTEIRVNPTLPTVTRTNRVTLPLASQNSSICYKYVGCFSNYPPFNNAGGVLPSPPERIGTVFLLYTNNNNLVAQQLDYKDRGASLRASNFNPRFPTKFVIHGFTQDEKEIWLHTMKDALLMTGPLNVVIVGWKEGAELPDYPRAVANTRVVAKQVVGLINLMIKEGMELDRIHLIGHSLGAQISGYAGSDLNGKLGRISGMDPAGPLYEGYDDKVHLDKSDAKFVDVIHSNAKPLSKAGAGYYSPCGHVDFYPNGGVDQPGCPAVIKGIFSKIFEGNFDGVADVASCSHSRSHQLFIESIPNGNHCGLKSFPCASWVDDVTTCSHSRSHYLYQESISNDECMFVAHPCTSWDDYDSGKCSLCGEHGCSELGYHSIEYAARGSFFLKTKGFESAKAPDGEQFCGIVYDVTISPQNGHNIKGKIDLKITGSKSSVVTPFQGADHELTGDTKIVVIDYDPLGDLQSVGITYTKAGGWLFGYGSGDDNWKLNHIIIKHEGKMKKFCSGSRSVTVTTGRSVLLKLCD